MMHAGRRSPMSLITGAFDGSKVCQIYQGKEKKKTTFDILQHLSFPWAQKFDVGW